MKPSTLLTLNPELQRNLWLEFSVGRLIAMPAVIGVLSAIVWQLFGREHVYAVLETILWILVTVWGTWLASDSVGEEMAGRTWALQRLSGQRASQLILGKLIGSTSYVWYGAAICVAGIYAFSPSHLHDIIDTVLQGLVAQTTAMFVALLLIRFGTGEGRKRITSLIAQAIGILFAAYFSVVIAQAVQHASVPSFLGSPDRQTADWYGGTFFVTGIMRDIEALTIAWMIVGMMRLMRGELGYRDGPVVWIGFAVFLMVVIAGFAGDVIPVGTSGQLGNMRLFVVALGLTYMALLGLPVSFASTRKFVAKLRGHAWFSAWRSTPPWIASLILVLLAIAFYTTRGLAPELAGVAALGFLIRDALVVYGIRTRLLRRSELALIVYFIFAYGVLPFAIAKAGLLAPEFADILAALASPLGDFSASWGAAMPWVEAMLVYVLFRREYRRITGRTQAALADAAATV